MKKISVFIWMSAAGFIYVLTILSIFYFSRDVKKQVIRDFIVREQERIVDLGEHKMIRSELERINLENQGLSQEEIIQKDQLWIRAQEENPVIQNYLNNKISRILQSIQKEHPAFVELFVTDRYGLIAGATNKTSDFYQANETWWVNTQTRGGYVDQVVFDESARCWGYPVYYPIRDSEGHLLGTIKAVLDITNIV